MFAIFVLTFEVCILSVHGFKGWVLSNKEVSLASLFLPAVSLKFGKSCFALDVRMSLSISVDWFPDTTFLIQYEINGVKVVRDVVGTKPFTFKKRRTTWATEFLWSSSKLVQQVAPSFGQTMRMFCIFLSVFSFIMSLSLNEE